MKFLLHYVVQATFGGLADDGW